MNLISNLLLSNQSIDQIPLNVREAAGKRAPAVEVRGNVGAGENRVYWREAGGDVKVVDAFNVSSEKIPAR